MLTHTAGQLEGALRRATGCSILVSTAHPHLALDIDETVPCTLAAGPSQQLRPPISQRECLGRKDEAFCAREEPRGRYLGSACSAPGASPGRAPTALARSDQSPAPRWGREQDGVTLVELARLGKGLCSHPVPVPSLMVTPRNCLPLPGHHEARLPLQTQAEARSWRPQAELHSCWAVVSDRH